MKKSMTTRMTKVPWLTRAIGLSLCLLALASPVRAQEAPRRSAAWEAYCAVCHGPDGKANTEEGKKKGARDFGDARWQATVSDSRLEGSIKRGRDKMPSFGKKLTEDQVKALVAEVRALASK